MIAAVGLPPLSDLHWRGRPSSMGKRKGTHRKLSLAEAVAQVDKLEAMLARKTWAPTTSILIPSILMSADALLKQLRYQAYKSRSDALLQAQVERLEMLCSNFKRQR